MGGDEVITCRTCLRARVIVERPAASWGAPVQLGARLNGLMHGKQKLFTLLSGRDLGACDVKLLDNTTGPKLVKINAGSGAGVKFSAICRFDVPIRSEARGTKCFSS